MLSVKLLRSLVLGESIINTQYHHDVAHTHMEYDADDHKNDDAICNSQKLLAKKKMPLLLFLPTQELISDTFRLASIARDVGMDFRPSSTLSHLLFSWPSSPSSSPSSSSSLPSPFSSSSSTTSIPALSFSAAATTTTTTLPNDAVPLPFPSLSTSSSISLLRYFVSLSKGLFKLVFLEIDAHSRFNFTNYCNYYDYDCSARFRLVYRVSRKLVGSMEEFSRVLAGNGWTIFRSSENKNTAVPAMGLVYMFRKKDANRVRAKRMINSCGGGGEGRIRELRSPTLDFKNGVSLRVLQYILLMTDDVFYIA